MSQSETSTLGRTFARNFIVAVLGIFVLATTIPGLSIIWDSSNVAYGQQGPLGFAPDYDGAIKHVVPDSPGWNAGIRPGDGVDLWRTAIEDRSYVAGAPARLPAQKPVRLVINRQGGENNVTLVAPPHSYPLVAKINLLNRSLATLIFVVVGGVLVILRPSPMTWGFFFYCLGFSPGIGLNGFSRFPSATSHATFLIIADILTAAGTAGILMFALQFFWNEKTPWRLRLQQTIPYLFVAFMVLIAYPDIANLILGRQAEVWQRTMLAAQGLVFALTIFAALQTYIHGKRDDRPRIQWVVVGLCVGIIGTYVGSVLLFSSALPFHPPRGLESALLTLNVVLPLAVGYAVIRHRVLEVSFVVSRALIYGVLTFIVLSLFAFIDWFIGRELEAVRLASFLEIGVAIGLSFWLNSLEKRVETVVATVFFRKRREALLRMQHAAEAVHHALKVETVYDYQVREPVDALALSSAALFLPNDDGSYGRVQAIGWDHANLSLIAHDDPLTLELSAEGEPLRVASIGWRPAGLPTGDAAPILAIPIVSRRELLGIGLYGPHSNGADIDPDEAASIDHLARAAQATYDHLRVRELEAQIAKLRARVDRQTTPAS